jgi:hypothetical protein
VIPEQSRNDQPDRDVGVGVRLVHTQAVKRPLDESGSTPLPLEIAGDLVTEMYSVNRDVPSEVKVV